MSSLSVHSSRSLNTQHSEDPESPHVWHSLPGTALVRSGWCLLWILQVLLAHQVLSPLLLERFHSLIGAPLCTQFSSLVTCHPTRSCSSPQMLQSCSIMPMPGAEPVFNCQPAVYWTLVTLQVLISLADSARVLGFQLCSLYTQHA